MFLGNEAALTDYDLFQAEVFLSFCLAMRDTERTYISCSFDTSPHIQ